MFEPPVTAPPAPPAIAVEDLSDWKGTSVIDVHSEQLGKLDELYYDVETDTPAFASVRSGLTGKHFKLIPLAGASVARGHLRVAVERDAVKQAPGFGRDAELSLDDEAGVYDFYELPYNPAGQGARRLARR